MNEKFSTLKELIKEYHELVQKNTSALPPYAKFETYLVGGKEDYINRPEKIGELVDNLNSENNDNKIIDAIMELWSHGGTMYIDKSEKSSNKPRIIHSVSNTTRLQSFLEGSKDSDDGKLLDKGQLVKFAKAIGSYVKNHEFSQDNQHKLIEHEDFKKLLKNNIDSVINEILFWYYYGDDKYPIINSRLKNSRLIINKSLGTNYKNDIELNGQCSEYLSKIEEDNITITKQLMLDQLFFSIDEMKSMKRVDKKYEDKNNDIYKFYQKLWHTIKEAKRVLSKDELDTFKNVIYHGAPGTGKTYELKKEIKEYLDYFDGGHSEFIQFHSSYYYEDFIGGLKPNTKSENGLSLEFRNGVFKELCRKAAQYEIAYYTSKDWNDETKNEVEFEVESKEFTLNKENPDFSQFPPFFILIDEINRADLSKVFGELLFAIEDDYRGFEHAFKLSTSQMENEETAVLWDEDKKEAKFFVPVNLYIRGTMNDIDRSVDSIDFAFRRRFKWVEKNYDENILQEMLFDSYEQSSINNYVNLANKLNKKIVAMHIDDKSYEIGHAIFRNIVKYTKDNKISERSREKLFDNHIEPIVYNYLKMDYGNESKDLKNFRDDFVKKANEKN